MKHLFFNPAYWRAPKKSGSWNQYARYVASKSATQAIEIKEEKYVRRHRWELHENLVLIAAKEKQAKELAKTGNEGLQTTSNQKWEDIAVFCYQNGINRTAMQCKDKWHRLLNAFSKIKNWESCRPPGKRSFWQMKSGERSAEGLCFKLDKQIYDALDTMNNTECDSFNVSTDDEECIQQVDICTATQKVAICTPIGQCANQENLEKISDAGASEMHSNGSESSGILNKDNAKQQSHDVGDSTIQPNLCIKEVGVCDRGEGQDETVRQDEDDRPPLIVNTILTSLNELKQLE